MKPLRYIALALILARIFSPAHADEKIVPQSQQQVHFSFAPVVKKAAPAVVNIYTKSHVQVQDSLSPFMNDPFFKQFFGQGNIPTFGGRPREQVVSSLGSGVIVKPDGMIVTSFHVIKDAQEITVVLSDKREFEAKVVLRDPQSDLAFLRVPATDPLPYLEMRDSDSLEVGDLVLAIGNPFGVGQTVTSGIVSGLARKAEGVSDYQFFIQTDAAINPGNSGGALVDMDGRLIGINTAIYSRSGGSNGIGFAIPANMVRSLLESKAQEGRVVRPWLGMTVQPVTAAIAESVGMKTPQGVIVTKIHPGSPADKGGLQSGDIILAVNGTEIANEQDMHYRLALAKMGDTARLDILRNGQKQMVGIELLPPPEDSKSDQRTLKGQQPLSGVTVVNLSPALAAEMGLDMDATGVMVTASEHAGPGLGLALQRGDIIREINGTKVTSTSQLEGLLSQPGHRWQIVYQRGGNVMTLTVRM